MFLNSILENKLILKNTIEKRRSCTLFLDSILENDSQERLLGNFLGFRRQRQVIGGRREGGGKRTI